MGELSVWHWLIVALVLVMLFGAKRLPDTAKSLGQALRLFKETSRIGDDDDADAAIGERTSTAAPALSIEEQARRLE
ncbi:Sec-independent protein translocase subunit TatA [Planotetraspora sp. GP83]|uniref:Sec-independent protein translocase subunit TatA n=1 Tax=Planotetraspora sp. GP83 TaxID=3156264 RepID=UPI003514D522